MTRRAGLGGSRLDWVRSAPHEVALLSLAFCMMAAGAFCGAPKHALGIVTWALPLGLAARLCPWRHRWAWRARVVAAYLLTLGLYQSVEWLTPALGQTLGTTLADSWLLAADRALFGETPAMAWHVPTGAWADLLSASYFSYHLFLHGTLAATLFGSAVRARELSAFLFACFAVGLVGYLCVPALGPLSSIAGVQPVTGGAMTTFNAWFTAAGSSVYDVFPSLHVLIAGALMWHHARTRPRLAALLVIPFALLSASTLLLRYHYAVDLLASALLLASLIAADHAWRRRFGALSGWELSRAKPRGASREGGAAHA